MWIFALLLGLAAGSFVNVVIYRLPKGISIITSPPSSCPSCHKVLKIYDNVPLLSYLLLRGRCRFCRAAISWRYPLVEFLAGAMAGLIYLRLGLSPELFVYFFFVASLLALSFIDLDTQLLPDVITIPGIIVGLIASTLTSMVSPLDSIIGVGAGGGFFLFIAWAYQAIRGRAGLGGGDVKLLAMVGAFLGWQGLLPTILVGSLSGLLAAVIMIIKGGRGVAEPLPFGPFLSLGATATLIWMIM